MKNDYQKKIDLYGHSKCFVEYVQHMGDDLTIVNAARVSFGKHKTELDKKDKKLIKYLIDHRHTSTLEHCHVTFRCKVPLFVRSQHHRHRTWSYNEISRRYTDFNLEFYEQKIFERSTSPIGRRQMLIQSIPKLKFEWAPERSRAITREAPPK